MKSGGTQTTTTAPTGPASQYLTGVMANGANPDYSAVTAALNGADNQQWNNFYQTQLPLINQRASFLGNQSAGVKDLNSAITNIGTAQANAGQQAYLGAYNAAQNNALTAAGDLGGTKTLSAQPGSGQGLMDLLGGGVQGVGLLNALLGNGTPGGSGANSSVSGLLSGLKGLFGGQPATTFNPDGSLNYGGGSFYSGPQASDSAYFTFLPTYGAGDLTNPGTPNLDDLMNNYQLPDDSGWGFKAADGEAVGTPGYGGEMAGGEFGIPMGTGSDTSSGLSALTEGDLAPGSMADVNSIRYSGVPSSGASPTSPGSLLGDAGSAFGIYTGLQRGGVMGDAGAALGAANLAKNAGAFGADTGAVAPALGGLGAGLGIVNGLQQGGIVGDTSAAINAVQAYNALTGGGAGALGATAGYAAPVLAAFAAMYGIQQHNSLITPKEAMGNAEAGAQGYKAVGSNPANAQYAGVDAQAAQAMEALKNLYANSNMAELNSPNGGLFAPWGPGITGGTPGRLAGLSSRFYIAKQ